MKYIILLKFFFWKIMYAYYMNKKIKDIKFSLGLAFKSDHDFWFEESAKEAVDNEVSYWGESI